MKELKELVKFSIKVGQGIDKALEDKKLDAADLLLFIPLIMQAPEAFNGASKCAAEWKESSFEQKQMLIKEIEQELDLKNDKTEKIIENSLQLALLIHEFIKLIKE
jgi:hypothetical protein